MGSIFEACYIKNCVITIHVIKRLKCISFSGSKYDLNLIKKYLAVHLKMHESKTIFAVKRNNQYACLSNENFKFLDITHCLAPGVNYATLIKAFDVKESKGFSPTNGLPLLKKLTIQNYLLLVPLGFHVLFVCVEVLRPGQPNGVMSSEVSLSNHTFTGQA